MRARCWWVGCVFVVAVSAVACGGGGSSRSVGGNIGPSTPTTPTPAPATPLWSITGTVTDTTSRAAIAGATITPSWGLAAVTTGAAGDFSLGSTAANPPTTPYDLSVSAGGYLTRKQWVTWQAGARSGIGLDLIRNASPFSLDFYGQFVRGTFDQSGAPWPVLRWNAAPNFYVKTVDQIGRAIEPEVLTVVLSSLARAVPIYTGGAYGAAAIESGTAERAAATNWINVNILRDASQRTVCGSSRIGANPGEITLYDDVCSCGSVKIPGSVVLHEVGHAMGFFHVGDRSSVMYPTIPGNCPAGEPSANERFHATVAYSRPRGNTEPDNDPSSGAKLRDGNDELGPAQPIVN